MLDRIKVLFPTQFTSYFSVVEPRIKAGYPFVIVHEGNSSETMQTTDKPLIEAHYLIEVVDRFQGTSNDESAAQLAHQRCMQLADSIKELLRTDAPVRALCLDFRATVTRPELMQEGEYSQMRQPLQIMATFNTNAGVYGYSLYGYAIYG